MSNPNSDAGHVILRPVSGMSSLPFYGYLSRRQGVPKVLSSIVDSMQPRHFRLFIKVGHDLAIESLIHNIFAGIPSPKKRMGRDDEVSTLLLRWVT